MLSSLVQTENNFYCCCSCTNENIFFILDLNKLYIVKQDNEKQASYGVEIKDMNLPSTPESIAISVC